MAKRSLLVAAMAGVALIAAVPVMLFAVGSDVEGTLDARAGRLGQFRFTPDRCASGQTLGFFGVELRSSDGSEHRVRLIRDSVEGSMVAFERAGQSDPPIVLRPQECRQLEVQVVRTNTMVNSVYVVKGTASIDCGDDLVGTVTFDGCS